MPNAPWATTNTGPNPSDLYPEPPQKQTYGGANNSVSMSTPGMEPIYNTYWLDANGNRTTQDNAASGPYSEIVGYQSSSAAGKQNATDMNAVGAQMGGSAGNTPIENRQMLDQLRAVLLGDPGVAQQTLAQMGWTGTVDDFKALTPAQQNVWAHEHAAATKGVANQYGWNSTYGGFYRDPNTGVIDFTKWWDGSASGYDANMNPTSAATIHPGVAASNKVKQQSLAPMKEKLTQAIAQTPQLSKYAGQVGQPAPTTVAQPPLNQPQPIQPPPDVTAPGFPSPNGEVRIMPAPGRPMPPPQQPTNAPVSQPTDVRIRVPGRR